MVLVQWLISTVIGSVSKNAADALLAWLKDRQVRADQVALGQARQVAVDQAAASAAHQRMEQAAAEPKGREETQKALGDGKF